EDEGYNGVVEIWRDGKDEIEGELMECVEKRKGMLMMSDCGGGGKGCKFRELGGMGGLMAGG
ncbi:hypothetical protein, partial [Staphylococcus haemolyticus]|uniref:hypothetical protein n=1 Tax=Staphylococcus haemolyticus TaxID=1283 RepID=UPI0016425EDE